MYCGCQNRVPWGERVAAHPESRRAWGDPAVGSSSKKGRCLEQTCGQWSRCFQPAGSVPAIDCALVRRGASVGRRADAAGHAVHAGDEFQVFAQRQILPDEKRCVPIADMALDLAGMAKDVEAEGAASSLSGVKSAQMRIGRSLAAAGGPQRNPKISAPPFNARALTAWCRRRLVQALDAMIPRRLRCHRSALGKETAIGCPGEPRREAGSGSPPQVTAWRGLIE